MESSSDKFGKYLNYPISEYFPHKIKGFATKAIHAGQEPEKVHGSVNVPIHLSTTFAQHAPTELYSEFDYARCGNPTRKALEDCLAACENGKHCIVFSSGCAAMTCVLHMLQTGDHMICCDDVYGGTQRYIRKFMQDKYKIAVDFIDLTNIELVKKTFRSNTRLVWIETPTNPLIKIVDIAAIVKAKKEVKEVAADCMILADNTFASPYLQNPLDLGVDITLQSLTKYIGGHSDVVMGALIVKSKELNDKLFFAAKSFGGCPGAFDCYMALRGIKTLEARMLVLCKSAYSIAKFLESHELVEKVLYPGLTSHPQHELAKNQMRSYGGMLSFYIKGGMKEARKFLSSVKVATLAESLGGVESLIEHPATMTHASVPLEERTKLGIGDNFIRFSTGIEDVEDLMEDLDQALRKSQEN